MGLSYTWADYSKVNRAEAGRDDRERVRLVRLAERRLRLWWTLPLTVLVFFAIFPVAVGRSAEGVSYGLATALVVLTAGMYYMKMWHLIGQEKRRDEAPTRPMSRPVEAAQLRSGTWRRLSARDNRTFMTDGARGRLCRRPVSRLTAVLGGLAMQIRAILPAARGVGRPTARW